MGCVSRSSLVFFILVLLQGCFAQVEPEWESLHHQQLHRRLRSGSECRVDRITAREPNRRCESEAGFTELWDSDNSEELECAGMEVLRHTVQPRGLILPHYTNTPHLIFIVQGRGIAGIEIPGCAETFEASQEGQRRERRDRHQKVIRFRQGDVIAVPNGLVHWTYNDGELPLVTIAFHDFGNHANQLDERFRMFFLAGNSREEQGQGQGRKGMEELETRSNIFNGFDEELLSEAFNIESETARKLKGQDDQRGHIVRAERFEVLSPELEEREEEEGWEGRRGQDNGLEETICSKKFRLNIGSSIRADAFNPRGGRITYVNSFKLPILSRLQLTAERGVLYRNAFLAPHWNLNAHSVMYVTRGSSRIQIVGNNGESVFDDEVREGQLIVVPQNFAVIKKAGDQGCEWVAIKTNENAVSQQLAGTLSAIRAIPEDVLINSYEISREQARSLKYNRRESLLFSSSRSPSEY